MQMFIILPIALGAMGILQAALNKNMITDVGLAKMTWIGCVVTVVVAGAFYLLVKMSPSTFPEFMKIRGSTFKWWFIIPGIFGFLFVAGLPFSIYKVGAVKTTVGLIAAQMVTSTLWDSLVEGIALSYTKGAGIVFALLSVLMITLAK
jgi:transporter family-2 protein